MEYKLTKYELIQNAQFKDISDLYKTDPERTDRFVKYIYDRVNKLDYTDPEDAILNELSIGNMIEMIHEYDCDLMIESSGNNWYVDIGHISTESDQLYKALLDALIQIFTE